MNSRTHEKKLVISEELPHVVRELPVRLAISHDLPIEVGAWGEILLGHGGVGCLLRCRMDYVAHGVSQEEGRQSADSGIAVLTKSVSGVWVGQQSRP